MHSNLFELCTLLVVSLKIITSLKIPLKKFEKNIHLIKGNSNQLLKKMDMSQIDYIFLDGGHAYETVKNDLHYSKPVLENNGTILCDDYNLTYAPGVKQAIDEFVNDNNLKSEIIFERFAKIEKN